MPATLCKKSNSLLLKHPWKEWGLFIYRFTKAVYASYAPGNRKLTFKIEYLLVLQTNRISACFVLQSATMNLMMYIGNDLIESVPLEHENIPLPGYLGSFKRSLKEKYRELIQQFSEPPEFLVINPFPSA